MLKRFLALCFLFIACFANDTQDPVLGMWKSVDEKSGKPTAIWQLYKTDNDELRGEIMLAIGYSDDTLCQSCGAEYESFPLHISSPGTLPLLGTPFIYAMKNDKLGKWVDGYIIDPDTGKYYSCKLEVVQVDKGRIKQDVLKVRGALIGFSFIGHSQYWQRSNLDELALLKRQNPKK